MGRELMAAIALELTGIIVILAGIIALLTVQGEPTPAALIAFGSVLIALGSLWFAKIYRGGPLREQLTSASD